MIGILCLHFQSMVKDMTIKVQGLYKISKGTYQGYTKTMQQQGD